MSADAPRRRDGQVRAYTKDGSSYVIAPHEHVSVLEAWMAGRAFWSGAGIYGEPVTIKLSEVQGVALLTAETQRLAADDDRECTREDRERSMLDGDPS